MRRTPSCRPASPLSATTSQWIVIVGRNIRAKISAADEEKRIKGNVKLITIVKEGRIADFTPVLYHIMNKMLGGFPQGWKRL